MDGLQIDVDERDLVILRQDPDALEFDVNDGDIVAEPADGDIIVEFHSVGLPGRDGVEGGVHIHAVADTAMPKGQPVAVDRATGRLVMADADWKPHAFVTGLLEDASTAGFVATASGERVTLVDWSAIAGTATLAPGQSYFLKAGGGITAVPPLDAVCLALVGKALSPSTLLITPQPPIEL